MKRLLGLLGLVELVWTEDYDGDMRLRIVHNIAGMRRCNSLGWGKYDVKLNANGTTSGVKFVKLWYPWRTK